MTGGNCYTSVMRVLLVEDDQRTAQSAQAFMRSSGLMLSQSWLACIEFPRINASVYCCCGDFLWKRKHPDASGTSIASATMSVVLIGWRALQ